MEMYYGNLGQEYLVIVRYWGKVTQLVIGSPHLIMIYSNHKALKDIFIKGNSKKARINGQLDQLGKFDIKPIYCPLIDWYIGIMDGKS